VLSLSPHKNVAGLLQAFRIARERFALPHELHLVGMPGTGARRVRAALDRAAADGLPVRALGYLDEAALWSEYAAAALFAFVPLVEGFGLPVLEAMAHGVPVVASRVSSLPETCGDAALLVEPDDAAGVAQAIGSVLADPRVAARLAQAGRARVRDFTWELTARATRAVYEAAAAGRQS
jgi:glycosyltransferase involved in cell wall biosynthesis